MEDLEDKSQLEKFTRKSSWSSLWALEFISVNTWKSLRPQGASAALKFLHQTALKWGSLPKRAISSQQFCSETSPRYEILEASFSMSPF